MLKVVEVLLVAEVSAATCTFSWHSSSKLQRASHVCLEALGAFPVVVCVQHILVCMSCVLLCDLQTTVFSWICVFVASTENRQED